nr:hypothetical protein [Geomicrobium sp. JCM 19038]
MFAPAVIPLMVRLGFDRLTALAAVLVSTVAGFTAAITGPATVGVAHEVSELPLYSGYEYRALIFLVITTIGIIFVSRYARKIKQDKTKSLVYGDGIDETFVGRDDITEVKATKRQMAAIVVLFAGILLMIFGLIQWGWYFRELGGLYLTIGIVIG